MPIPVRKTYLIRVAESVIEPPRRQIFPGVVWEQSAVGFQRVDEESVERRLTFTYERICTWIRIDGQNALQTEGARLRGQGLARETGDDRIACFGCQSAENRILRSRRTEETCAGQDWYRILGVLEQPFEGNKQKRFVFLDREARRAAKLIAGQGILGIGAVNVRLGRIENRTRRQGLGTGKRVSGVQSVVAEKTI